MVDVDNVDEVDAAADGAFLANRMLQGEENQDFSDSGAMAGAAATGSMCWLFQERKKICLRRKCRKRR